MALEALVLSQQQSSQQGSRFGCGAMAAGGPWSSLLFSGMEGVVEMGGTSSGGGGWNAATCSPSQLLRELGDNPAVGALPMPSAGTGSASAGAGQDALALAVTATAAAAAGRRKRRRMRPVKNAEEVESQRMIHIAVERNRRKQMNEYLAALRSLMPPAYTQRGDQASIVGGAINFVKELEQLVQSLEAQRRSSRRPADDVDPDDAGPFADFFTFPQYSMCAAVVPAPENKNTDHREGAEEEASGSKPSAVADVEATMVESHANLRVLSRRRPRQLLRLVLGLQGHRLTVLHLNMSSAGHMVLYSFSLKVEDDCQLTSVDEIAAAAHQIVEKINEEQQGCSLE